MVNPPKLNPTKRNAHSFTSPWYSGEKNKKGTPNAEPKESETIKKRSVQ
jgi:hypothetical protein